MFVGHSTGHAGIVYHFIHSKTYPIIYSHDVQWLNQLCGDCYRVSPEDHLNIL